MKLLAFYKLIQADRSNCVVAGSSSLRQFLLILTIDFGPYPLPAFMDDVSILLRSCLLALIMTIDVSIVYNFLLSHRWLQSSHRAVL